jgi:CubicO group peptidase (beta-lactamase class C family)
VLSKPRRRRYAPGSRARYSNIGYLAVGQVIAVAAGVPYEEFVCTQVLGPLGMTHTGFRWADAALSSTPRITGHFRLAGVGVPIFSALLPRGLVGPRAGSLVTLRPFELDGAAYGGLIGTVSDAARLLAVYTNRGTVGTRRLLHPESVEAMITITVRSRPYDVGLGWFRPNGDRPNRIEHLGGGIGYFNVMRLDTRTGGGAVVMSNITKHWGITPFADSQIDALP